MEPRSRSDPGHGSGPPRYPGTFLLAFREALAVMKWEARRWLGHVVECVDAEGNERSVGLENLYRRCRRADRLEWPDLIKEFLKTVLAAEQTEDLPTDLAVVADQLLVRLGQPLHGGATEEIKVWSQPLPNTSLVVNLVIDYPDRMIYATEPMIAASGKPGEEWLQRALANLRKRTPPDCLQSIHDESGMMMCNVADAYDSSRALLLEDLLPSDYPNGCLIALPSRDQLLALPVDRGALAFAHLMKVLAERNYRSAPYAISEDVFWVREGVWRVFPMDVQGDKVTLQPPEEFMDIVSEFLPEDEEDESEDESDDEDELLADPEDDPTA